MALALIAGAALTGCESTPILLYHSVGEEYPDDRWVSQHQLREQLELLLEQGYTVLTASELDAIELRGAPRPPQPIVLTFDDGYENFLLHALPVLEELNVGATLFVPTDRIGASAEERVSLGARYLVWPELLGLEAEGVDIQSHSSSHPRMRDLADAEALEELAGSKRILERELGHEVTVFAYPFGSVSPRLEDLAEEAGYESAHSVGAGLNGRYARQRISIHAGVDLETFQRMIRGTWWGESSGAR